jgi:hypothetical protein
MNNTSILKKISKLGSKMQRNVREGRKVDTKDKKEYNRLSNIFFRTVKSPLLKTLKNKPKPPPKKKPSPPPKKNK